MNIIKVINDEFNYILEAYKDSLSLHLNRGGQENFDYSSKYFSDFLQTMQGRGTGHFGSGTYFSSYKDDDKKFYDEYLLNIKYNPTSKENPIIKIRNDIYLVDLDYYKLYKPVNREHAEILFNVLKKINSLVIYYSYENKIDLNLNKEIILEIKNDLNKLDLKLPNLNDFINYFKKLNLDINTKEKFGSVSTKFMEYNGYNGVNVNHIPGFDNTLHGTVIYDLTKTIEPTTIKYNKYKSIFADEDKLHKVVKTINKYGMILDDISWLNINQTNYIFNTIKKFIKLDSLKFSLEENKITQEQFNHILKIYPKYIKRLINSGINIDFDFDTIIFLLGKDINIFNNISEDNIYFILKKLSLTASYKIRENKELINIFLNNIESKYNNNRDIMDYVEEIINDME
jgi:hypothetical protein